MEREDEELEAELETELETDEEVVAGEDGEPVVADGEPVVEPKETVEDAISAALKALEPKTPEQKAAEAAEAAKTPEQKAADKAAKEAAEPKLDKDGKPVVAEVKKADPINDPIPPQVSERTRERITSLVSTVKEQAATVENQGAIINAIQATGTTPEEFGAMVTYMGYMHSDKTEDLEKAYGMLQGGLRTIALKLGRTIPEVNMLEGHQDLLDEIASGQITQKRAEEVALSRARTTQTTASAQAMTTAAQTEAAAKQERDTAISELNDIGAELKKNDPLYQAKYDTIVPSLMAAFKHMAPSKWKAAFHEAYKAVKVAPKAAPAAIVPVKPKQQPLRPSAPAGGGKREPANVQEAMFGEGFPS